LLERAPLIGGRQPDGVTPVAAAGFTPVEITPTHEVADGMHSATVRAVKPVALDRP